MIHIDLFSGIGGFSLGLKMAGFEFEQTYYSDIGKTQGEKREQSFGESCRHGEIVPNPEPTRLEGQREDAGEPAQPELRDSGAFSHADKTGLQTEGAKQQTTGAGRNGTSSPWAVEPNVGRVAHGIPARVDRLKCLGNAVVPQVVAYVAENVVRGLFKEGEGF